MDGVQRFVSRPEQVEAVRVTEENAAEVAAWMGASINSRTSSYAIFRTRGLLAAVGYGDWIVEHPDQQHHLFTDDDFQRRYERCSSPMPAASDD